MNSRAFTLSLVIAFIAMFMVYSYMEGREKLYIQKYGNEVAVIVAKDDIPELDLLNTDKVLMVAVPEKFKAPGAITDMKEIENTIASVPIKKGEQITRPRITIPGAVTGLSRQVSAGKRAVAIQVNESDAVGKLIKPGDRVDVIGVVDYSGGRKDLAKAKTVLQDVLVLSTGMNITNAIPMADVKNGEGESRRIKLNTFTQYNSVTLELDPFQVQKIVFMTWNGTRHYLSLRNNDDKKIVKIQGTRLFDLLEEDAGEAKIYFDEKNNQGSQAPGQQPPAQNKRP